MYRLALSGALDNVANDQNRRGDGDGVGRDELPARALLVDHDLNLSDHRTVGKFYESESSTALLSKNVLVNCHKR